MILDGKSIVDKMMVTFPDDLYDQREQEQPNGLDLRVHRIFQVTGRAALPSAGKMDTTDMQVAEIDPKGGWFDLRPNQGNYAVDFREFINVPERYCAIIIGRSSLLRVGAFVTSAVWDSGFSGRLGAFIRINNPIRIQYGARLAQVLFMQAEYNGGLGYQGQYQGGDSQVGFFQSS